VQQYIVLLRGINVGGQKKMKMAELRQLLENLGFQKVATYIQSGNIILHAANTDSVKIKQAVQTAIRDQFGYDVPVLVKSYNDFKEILEQSPYKEVQAAEGNRLYFVLLHELPDKTLVKALEEEAYEGQDFTIIDDRLYLWCENGYGNAKLDNNLVERKLKVEATTRNYRTMLKLLEMGGK